MTDFRSDLKEDEVPESQSLAEIPEDDGWGAGAGSVNVETKGSTTAAIDAVRADLPDDGWDQPVTSRREFPSGEEVVPEPTQDGWGDTPPKGNDSAADQGTDLTAQRDVVEAARADVAAAYEHAEATQPEFADISYAKLHDGGDAIGSDHLNQEIRVEMADGTIGHLKPSRGELPGARLAIPDETGWKREVAACELDRLLNMNVVPETVAVSDPELGPASLQSDVPTLGKPLSGYSAEDIDRMAVMDYVMGNTDRHPDNYLTFEDGRPAAIDNGYSFPVDGSDPIKSDFVVERLDQPLSSTVLNELNSAEPEHLAGVLRECGIESSAIEGCLARLQEVRDHRMIVGSSWGAAITDGVGVRIR